MYLNLLLINLMNITINMKEKQTENIIKWLDALPKYRKTYELLGKKDKNNEWSYCCLGVGCRVMNVRNVNFEDPSDMRITLKLSLNSDEGAFNPFVNVNDRYVTSLTGMNDETFYGDKDFTNMRKAMLLTLDSWIKDKDVCKAVKKHFANEIRKIKKEGKIIIEE